MDKKIMSKVAWCKSDWSLPTLAADELDLLKQCSTLPATQLIDDVDEIIRRSDEFPGTFPLESNRLKTLKQNKPLDILKRNILSTYPLLHERVLYLMAKFIILKRKQGSAIEKQLYQDMTIPQLIDRLLTKRALTFMTNRDKFLLVDGSTGYGGFESIGTASEKAPLSLKHCLSYDEIKLSAMLYVSSYTVCINDGNRKNHGAVNDLNVEKDGVIIGVIGPRFQRDRMDCEDILITEAKNTKENGYADFDETNSQSMMRKLWTEFYQVKSYTYAQVQSKVSIPNPRLRKNEREEKLYTERFVLVGKDQKTIFDNEAYYKRISIIADCTLFEADKRGIDAGKECFLNVVGCGLGVWKISSHQSDVYVLSFLERVRSLAAAGSLAALTHLNFAYIKISRALRLSLLPSEATQIFMKVEGHSKGGITILFDDREPSSRLPEELGDKLLVMTYAWDGNAQPGNEYWIGKTGSSGDSAAASATQVSELHNAFINPAVRANNAHITSGDIQHIQQYCSGVK